MGLAIWAARNLKATPKDEWEKEHPGTDAYDADNAFIITERLYESENEYWPGRIGNILPDVVYEADEGDHEIYSMGAYSTYGGWRNTLEEYTWEVEPVDSFDKIIDFSDCEGILGAKLCAELAADFAKHRNGYKEYLENLGWDSEDIEWYVALYDNFAEAATIAQEDGAILFC